MSSKPYLKLNIAQLFNGQMSVRSIIHTLLLKKKLYTRKFTTLNIMMLNVWLSINMNDGANMVFNKARYHRL